MTEVIEEKDQNKGGLTSLSSNNGILHKISTMNVQAYLMQSQDENRRVRPDLTDEIHNLVDK
jgi:hypothetical protein